MKEMKRITRTGGWTFVELLVVMALSFVVMGAIYAVYDSQAKTQEHQKQLIKAQQNLRSALFFLEKPIRMAGFDPTGTAGAGFVLNFSPTTYGETTSPSSIAFTVDADKSGFIDPLTSEKIAFRLNGDKLQQCRLGGGWQDLADNIYSLTFNYLKSDGNVVTPPITAANIGEIRAVRITIVSATDDLDRFRTLTAEAHCRNIGL